MLNILIADDHAIVRRGVRDILNDLPHHINVTEVDTAATALREIIKNNFDILILDVSFPDGNGLEILNQIRTIKPEIKVLFLSMYPEEQYARRAMKNGAYGYLTKDSAPTELVLAIEELISDRKYVTSTLAQILVEDLALPENNKLHEKLSDREFQIMLRLANGEKISQIATSLFISPKTVSTYRIRVFEKLRITSTAELVRYAIDNDLIFK